MRGEKQADPSTGGAHLLPALRERSLVLGLSEEVGKWQDADGGTAQLSGAALQVGR